MASIPAGSSTDLTIQPERRQSLAPLPTGTYGYGSSDTAGPELSLGLLWRVAVEWRWLILAALGVGLAGAVLVTLLTPLKYRSTATIELNPPQVEGFAERGGRSAQAASDVNFIGTQLGLLSSRTLAERVAQDLNLAANPAVVGERAPIAPPTRRRRPAMSKADCRLA